MAAKFVLFIASALFVKTISSQAIGACNSNAVTALAAEELALTGNALAYGSNFGRGLAYPSCNNYGLAANAFTPASGGGFLVQSFSPIAPTGITVISENAIEGALAVNGELPFLSAVAVEGALPSAGTGGINYGCGSGTVAIVSEGIGGAVGPYGAIAPAAGRAAFGPGLAGPGLGMGVPGVGFNGRAGAGCGFNGVY